MQTKIGTPVKSKLPHRILRDLKFLDIPNNNVEEQLNDLDNNRFLYDIVMELATRCYTLAVLVSSNWHQDP